MIRSEIKSFGGSRKGWREHRVGNVGLWEKIRLEILSMGKHCPPTVNRLDRRHFSMYSMLILARKGKKKIKTYVLKPSLGDPFTRQCNWANGPRNKLSLKFRVNGNESHLLNERLRLGSAGSFTWVSGGVMSARESANEVYSTKWKIRHFSSWNFHLPSNLFFSIPTT